MHWHRQAWSGILFGPDREVRTRSARRRDRRGSQYARLSRKRTEQGHVILDAAVDGASVRFLVDTGASLVTLTPADAQAAGITPRELVFNHRVSTANGSARMAPVTLREVRIGQLSIYDVPASVLEHLNISLLGMSFLSRLQSYEMRDGKLTIAW